LDDRNQAYLGIWFWNLSFDFILQNYSSSLESHLVVMPHTGVSFTFNSLHRDWQIFTVLSSCPLAHMYPMTITFKVSENVTDLLQICYVDAGSFG
jgi:hypothetical protein